MRGTSALLHKMLLANSVGDASPCVADWHRDANPTISPTVSSQATAPTQVIESSIPITWTATDNGDLASGIAEVDLWYKVGEQGEWTNSNLRALSRSSGIFYFQPTVGDGRYYFATQAIDWAGNTEDAPTGAVRFRGNVHAVARYSASRPA